jgi:hypothetical protein
MSVVADPPHAEPPHAEPPHAEPPRAEADSPGSDPVDRPATGGSGPDVTALQDRTPEWLRMPRSTAGWTALLGTVYLLLSYLPLYHTDLWGHLAYGRWIWENGRLPVTEPLLPLAQGMPMVDTAWLSQLIALGFFRQFGITAMQFLYAASITTASGLLLWGVLRRTGGSVLAGLIVLATFGLVDLHQLLIVRPQLAGLVLFVGLFVLLNAASWRRSHWIVVPVLFALWANLHGSWVVGLGLLGAMFTGRAFDVIRRTGSVRSVVVNRQVRRLFVLTELAAIAVLLNPYGLGVYAEVLSFAGNPNLQDLIEWEPLTLRMSQGKTIAVAALALMTAYRFSPRRITSAEVLLLVGLGGAALWSSRMVHWWGPVAAYSLALHVAGIARRWLPAKRTPAHRRGLTSVVTVGLLWIFFAYTPFGFTLLHGRPTDAQARAQRIVNSTSAQTPVAAVNYLRRHPVQGLVFNSYEWGDFLLFGGPRDLQLFTNSHAHLIPREVWQDSLTILRAGSRWDDLLDRYGVNTLVLNSQQSEALIRALKGDSETWDVAYEDRLVAVFRRRIEI